jgi:DNA polymerase-3 subunit delta
MLGRMELEKLALYVRDGGRVTLEDAMACVGDSGAVTLDDLAFAAADGDARGALGGLSRVFLEGVNAVAVLRTVSRHFQRLDLTANLVATGTPAEVALKSLKPPVFFKKTEAFKRQIRLWPPAATAAALDLLTEAERGCKTTGAPAQAICGDALLGLARMAARRRAGRAA